MKNLKLTDWELIAGEALLFVLVILVLWLDEFLDLPHLLLGAAQTPYRPQEYIIETASVLLVAVIVITSTLLLLRRARRLEKFLRICAWCKKVRVDDRWVSFEEYMLKEHDLRSSHGICEDCAAKSEERSRQKKHQDSED